MLRKLGVGRVIARATGHLHEHVLKEIGAPDIIKVEEDMGEIIALSQIIAPHVLQRYNFAAGYSLVEIKLGRRFEGKTLVESKVRQNYGLNIVALQKRIPFITEDGRPSYRIEINDSPMPMDVIESDDVVVLIGAEKISIVCLKIWQIIRHLKRRRHGVNLSLRGRVVLSFIAPTSWFSSYPNGVSFSQFFK